MKRTLFNRFFVKIDWSTGDLWWDSMEGHKQIYLFNVSVISRKTEEASYQGLQIIVGKLAVRVADLKSLEAK